MKYYKYHVNSEQFNVNNRVPIKFNIRHKVCFILF